MCNKWGTELFFRSFCNTVCVCVRTGVLACGWRIRSCVTLNGRALSEHIVHTAALLSTRTHYTTNMLSTTHTLLTNNRESATLLWTCFAQCTLSLYTTAHLPYFIDYDTLQMTVPHTTAMLYMVQKIRYYFLDILNESVFMNKSHEWMIQWLTQCSHWTCLLSHCASLPKLEAVYTGPNKTIIANPFVIRVRSSTSLFSTSEMAPSISVLLEFVVISRRARPVRTESVIRMGSIVQLIISL